VSLRAVRLRDGTYRLLSERVLKSADVRRLRLRGVVSFIDNRQHQFTLSAPGVSMIVHESVRRAHIADRLSMALGTAATPTLGSVVTTTGTLGGDGSFDAEDVQTTATTTSYDLEGVVLSVDQAAGTITVSADDDNFSGASITVTVPATLDISMFNVGEEVELYVQPTGATTATLLGSADDQGSQSAGDQGDQQGQNPGDQGDQGDQSAGDQGDQQSQGSGDQGDQQSQASGDQGATTLSAGGQSSGGSAGGGDSSSSQQSDNSGGDH
jgi:hypothetical protein